MKTNDPLFSPRQWAEHRQAELSRLAALQAAADAAGVALQPSAPTGAECDFCGGSIVGGICETCDSVFINGIRQRTPKPNPFMEKL